ncbi:hypothetical protein KOW79_020184 [Hemibagrus wyckioides]|uniref:Uncharacterized protein n=1 Tax=Hemibagrus wyckioides TaxID=337641 RepID=A0A9D3N5B4_9TELE|nr:hypothetical protein KOW79_020184 [Hemibagrus wyckioides]
MDTTKTAADSNTNNDNKAACSTEHIGPDGESSSVVIVEETKKSKGAIGLLTRKIKTKKASSKSDPDNKGTGGDPSSVVMVEETKKSPRHSSRYILHHMLKKAGKKHSSKSSSDLLDFSQNLELGYLVEASQQLLDREKCFFISQYSSTEVICTEGDKDDLKKDYDILMDHLKKAVHDSFNIDTQEILRSAIIAIVEQEEQDKLWEEAAEEAPSWRPMRCHDTIVKKVVEERLQQIDEDNNDPDILKREVVRIGSVIQNDLLQVVNHVQRCYSECYSDFNACNMYAQLYHQAFSTTLRKLRQCSVTMEDYRFILQQINSFSKDILNQDELNPHINTESLGALLPEEDSKALVEQYLLLKENEVKSWLSNALKLKEADWQANKKPELIDEYYYCDLALDAIGVVEGGVKEVEIILGNDKAQRILLQMDSFLMSYKNSMEEFLKNQEMDMTEIVKSQLYNINKMRDYIENQEELLGEMKVAWLSTVSELRDSCHSYLLIPIHKELMASYRKLWTPAWFSEHEVIIDELEDTLNEKMDSFKDLHRECQKELLSQLHFEGSEKEWLSEILPRVSEVIKEQDPESLELEICVLLKHHPDLSAQQVFQLLKLKSRCPDARMVRECYHQTMNNLEESEPNPAFFCHVPRNISMRFYSCFCMLPFYLNEARTCRK